MKSDTTIFGLRFQRYDNGIIHVHDDKKAIKLVMDEKDFKKEVKNALDQFSSKDGAVRISGSNNVHMYLIQDDVRLIAVVTENNSDIAKDLNKFLGTF